MTDTLPTSRRVVRDLPEQSFVFTAWPRGAGAADMLDRFAGGSSRTVLFVLGQLPGSDVLYGERRHGAWTAERAWLGNEDRAHYRYRHDDGARATICSAHQWVPRGTTPTEARWAWSMYRAMLRDSFGCGPLPTPAATGRELFLRSVPAGDGWPTVDDETAELIRSTSGQGRVEFFPFGPVDGGRLVDVDMRLAYGAQCRELPVGPAYLETGEPAGWWKGRALCSWSAPAGWAHLGILPEADPAGGWHYPPAGTGWVDVAELQLARAWGWTVHVVTSLVFKGRGDPLRGWAGRLGRHREQCLDAGWELVADMWRHTLIDAIGAFHGRAQRVTRIDHAEAMAPDDAENFRLTDDGVAWEETGAEQWTRALAHPEWSAAIWGRTRARLLDSPAPGGDRVGALYLPPASIVALLTDAIVTTTDPAWPDDGRPGRFNTKHVVDVETIPTTARKLLAARHG